MKEFINLHIVIAEDDVDDSEIIHRSFVKHASIAKVDLVKNGKELLDFLRNKVNGRPDIILTDINMPLVNGIEVLEEIFKDSQLATIPVFVYSSAINPIYEIKCKQLGALGYFIKPFSWFAFDEIPYQIIKALQQNWNEKQG